MLCSNTEHSSLIKKYHFQRFHDSFQGAQSGESLVSCKYGYLVTNSVSEQSQNPNPNRLLQILMRALVFHSTINWDKPNKSYITAIVIEKKKTIKKQTPNDFMKKIALSKVSYGCDTRLVPKSHALLKPSHHISSPGTSNSPWIPHTTNLGLLPFLIYLPTSNLTKSGRAITYLTGVKSFWNFAQSTAVSLPCSVQNFKIILHLKWMLWMNKVLQN